MIIINLYCRVCGLRQSDPPWSAYGAIPNYEICDCCGVEFGYEDSTYERVIEYRKRWLEGGSKWFNEKAKPREWILESQLLQIPEEYSRVKKRRLGKRPGKRI